MLWKNHSFLLPSFTTPWALKLCEISVRANMLITRWSYYGNPSAPLQVSWLPMTLINTLRCVKSPIVSVCEIGEIIWGVSPNACDSAWYLLQPEFPRGDGGAQPCAYLQKQTHYFVFNGREKQIQRMKINVSSSVGVSQKHWSSQAGNCFQEIFLTGCSPTAAKAEKKISSDPITFTLDSNTWKQSQPHAVLVNWDLIECELSHRHVDLNSVRVHGSSSRKYIAEYSLPAMKPVFKAFGNWSMVMIWTQILSLRKLANVTARRRRTPRCLRSAHSQASCPQVDAHFLLHGDKERK